MDIQYFVVSSFFSICFYKHSKFQLVGSVKVMWLQAVTCVTWSHNYDKRCNGVERAGKINEGWRLRLRLWVSPHVIYNCCFCDTPCNYHQKGRSSNWGIKPFWEVLKADWISCYHQLLNDGGLGAEVMLVGLFNMTTGTNIDVSVCPGPPPPAPPPHSSDILYCLSSFECFWQVSPHVQDSLTSSSLSLSLQTNHNTRDQSISEYYSILNMCSRLFSLCHNYLLNIFWKVI